MKERDKFFALLVGGACLLYEQAKEELLKSSGETLLSLW